MFYVDFEGKSVDFCGLNMVQSVKRNWE